jgi:hypothetical protein
MVGTFLARAVCRRCRDSAPQCIHDVRHARDNLFFAPKMVKIHRIGNGLKAATAAGTKTFR